MLASNLRAYNFGLTGGSPYDGNIIVAAKSEAEAYIAAKQYIDEYNSDDNHHGNTLSITGLQGSKPIERHTILSFVSGEA